MTAALALAGAGLAAPAGAAPLPDVSAPDTYFTMGPAPALTPGPVYFEFASTEAGTFSCSMDAGAWTPCSTPYATTVTAQGAHQLAVAATDTAGNVDATPALYGFTILAPVSATASVSTRAVSGGRRLEVDVDPDWAEGAYAFTVQKRRGSGWRTVKRTRTQGGKDVRVVDLGRGTYRVVIGSANSLSGVTSAPVRIKR